jgi:peptidoglycan hydrolase-like protein with peptidoglycan-binding domain
MMITMIKKTLNSLGLSFALVLAAVAFGSSPTQAQERGDYIRTTVDGKFDEYVDDEVPDLMAEDQTEAVQDVQILLNELGYYRGDISGVYDDELGVAVANFQSDYGLEMTGTVDEETWTTFRSIDTDAIYEDEDRYDAATGVYYNYRAEDEQLARQSSSSPMNRPMDETIDTDMNQIDTEMESNQSAPVRGLW